MSHYQDAFEESLAVQGAASALGFDWPDIFGVLEKVEEEVGEIREAIVHGDVAHARTELGDLFLISVNLARFLNADPAQLLHLATVRFQQRFESLKRRLAEEGKTVEACSLEELDAVWNEVKTESCQELEEPLDIPRGRHADSMLPSTENGGFSGKNRPL